MEKTNIESLKNITVIIPSLNPDKNLLEVASGISRAGFGCVIFVDDGSNDESRNYFDEAAKVCNNSVLLRHSINLGKGRALKTAFNYFLENRKSDIGVITVDGDNQHHIDDVIACGKKLCECNDKLVLGCRSFGEDGVPIKSSFGNRATAFFLRLLCGIKTSDTQTGLRGIPKAFVNELLSLTGERFDFETNMLLEAKRLNIDIVEVKIRTIYFENNKETHFNPLKDSILIYMLIFKFFFSGIASTVLDFVVFVLINYLARGISPQYRLLIATVGARIFSSMFNYLMNKSFVFSSKTSAKSTIVKYYLLCVVQTTASYFGVLALTRLLFWPDIIIKAVVDVILFFISFQIQRELVFKNKKIEKLKGM